jgi:membrane protein implicated in regulation of membrane protease activity
MNKKLDWDKNLLTCVVFLLSPIFLVGIFLTWFWNIGNLKIKLLLTILPLMTLTVYFLFFYLLSVMTLPSSIERVEFKDKNIDCISKDDKNTINNSSLKKLPICNN